ncbi:Arm DNA-binding domain-containing protein [Parabacteroides sp.]
MIRVCKDGKKKYQSLGISVDPAHWDFKKNKPKVNCPNKEHINKIITDKVNELSEQIVQLKSERKGFTANSLISKTSKKVQPKTVGDMFFGFIRHFE